mgnify:CR=1 FL=1
MINIPKGTKDVLPAESYKWHYVENTAREIAEVISPFFTDISIDDLTVVMQRHIDIDAWKDTPHLYEDDFNRLMDIMIEAKELNSKAPYDKLVTKKYADLIVNKK